MIRNGLAVVTGLAVVCLMLSGCGDDDQNGTSLPLLPTATKTPAATPTPGTARGPAITFFGITRADDTLVPPSGQTTDGLPIFTRQSGSGFRLVIEAKPGSSGAAVGSSAFQDDLSAFPDLQIEVSHALGNGSAAVCDNSHEMPGGVPAVDPPNFDPTTGNINAANDLGCRFNDGQGHPTGVDQSSACVLFSTGEYHFVNVTSTIQFCGFVTGVLVFPAGDTVVTARVRDQSGNIGPQAQIVIRIES